MVRALKSACNDLAAPHLRAASGSGSDREPSRLAAAATPPGRPDSPSTLACSDALRAGTARGPGSLMPLCRRLLDLGAGDGRLLLRVARQLRPDWQGTHAVLLDRRNAVSPETHKAFEALNWRTETREADVLDWLARPAATTYDVVITNLFLHHFGEAQLAGLLRDAAGSARVFIAVEPRRSRRSLFVSRWLWLIGCGHVTRHDAVVSIRAGFNGRELSRLWPADGNWALQEQPAGWCSHLFVARRRE
jgi:SAM-dependent methyltransferase